MRRIVRKMLQASLLTKILFGFVAGTILGGAFWILSETVSDFKTAAIIRWISPFGMILINMLKMVVIPVIFFSLITGAASLPLKKFGRIGLKVMLWYLFCSLVAAMTGTALALLINPGDGTEISRWQTLMADLPETGRPEVLVGGNITTIFLNMFQNPFEALASNNFLAIIVFAVLFGLAMRVIADNTTDSGKTATILQFYDIIEIIRDIIFKLVDWILAYSPVGIFALTVTNFGLYGPDIVGPYVGVTVGVITGIMLMIFVIYPLLLVLVTRKNPLPVLKGMDEAIITAFITRSSAATLPVSIRVIEERLKVKNELAGFALPLGATINMDGVCVHLPMFAVLAANIFNIPLNFPLLLSLVLTTVLASIGAGGVPGGSIMLLFIILDTMGLSATQTATIAALAMGINPILDMFETANNVTGDMVCTYAVADHEGLVGGN